MSGTPPGLGPREGLARMGAGSGHSTHKSTKIGRMEIPGLTKSFQGLAQRVGQGRPERRLEEAWDQFTEVVCCLRSQGYAG